MNADTIAQIAVQVPALALLSFVFLSVLKLILNEQGRRIDKVAEALDKLATAIREGTCRWQPPRAK